MKDFCLTAIALSIFLISQCAFNIALNIGDIKKSMWAIEASLERISKQ